MSKIIVSLFDYTGVWPLYFAANGYQVVQVDLKFGDDVLTWKPSPAILRNTFGVLAAPPCDHFSVSGAQYWPQKDKDGRTAAGVRLVMRTLDLVDQLDPKFWMLENPVGRLKEWIGPAVRLDGKAGFDPCDYAGYLKGLNRERERYTKKTCLWGKFRLPPKKRLEPIRTCSQGSWVQELGGKSERTKELRSATPMGFAKATWIGNRA